MTPTLNLSVIGEWFAASIPMLITLRVSRGSITPSTHSLLAA